MKSVFRLLHTIWVWFWFILMFILIYPFFVLFIQKESWKKYGHTMNRIWAHVVFFLCLPTTVEWRFKVNTKQQYIYCANHTSYLDIPTICYALPGYNIFIGKASLTTLPLFGYMFRNLYIPVNRSSKKSKYETILHSFEKLDLGYNLAIFPEGTISRNHAPNLIDFKDGAFRIAIEKKVPVVPVTIINNWIILPDGALMPEFKRMKAVIHEPIFTSDLTLDDVDQLKEQTRLVIENELKKHFPEKFNH